ALAADTAAATVLCHTRWASVGIISQPNAHPVNQEEQEGSGQNGPYVTAVLNGDVDNFAELRDQGGLQAPPEITTDAKIIPALVSRRLAGGAALEQAFSETVASFMGSVAIGCHTAGQPDKLLMALRGSGQGLYIGLDEDAFVVASEPYGVVEETPFYLRMDGETAGGQVVVLSRELAGELGGIRRLAYDGTEIPVQEGEITKAEITTRDIDRGDHPHFLLKEISEAPRSFHKTLRGKIYEDGGGLSVQLGQEALPESVEDGLRGGHIRRIVVIGQGTAAVAGQGVAAAMEDALSDTAISVTAMPATELSGFHLEDDMSDMLAVAISQSGTTTDTNRTVDLLRGRGAAVVAIVNRRNSDLTEKADGVLYTSDGRDIEMSVASTKAFYSQIAAGFLLAFAIHRVLEPKGSPQEQELLSALRELPAALGKVLDLSTAIGETAARHAPQRRYWAVVGNGKNQIAAQEIRIKLSELCYKSIACDATEDKKHIDLSAEPLILVCAAGLTSSTADDVAKELSIYRAHKAAPILIATSSNRSYEGALEVLTVPEVHPSLAFVLCTMVGHLFGYHAALAIDALAHPLRRARAAIENLVSAASLTSGLGHDDLLRQLAPKVQGSIDDFFGAMAKGRYNGHLEASTAVRLASLFRYVDRTKPLESYQQELGDVGTPSLVVEELMDALTRAIEELTRPVDAIKHQAKTVTVGISRSDEALLAVGLVKALLDTGAPRDRIAYRELRSVAALDPAVKKVVGHTRYRIQDIADAGARNGATIEVLSQDGIAKRIPSRTAVNDELRGTKQLVASERELLVARGRSDDRTVILVPEVQRRKTVGLTLLHVEFHDRLDKDAMRSVLSGYRRRYQALRALVTETEPSFEDSKLAEIPVVELLTVPVHVLADRWR
ncbi:MAG: SIS domain-containing protein, partial [Planctomycetota bacterium]